MWAYVYVMLIHIVNRTHIANPARRVRRRTPPATPALANRRAARTTLRDAASFDSRCPSPESTSRRPALRRDRRLDAMKVREMARDGGRRRGRRRGRRGRGRARDRRRDDATTRRDATLGVTYASLDDGTDATTDADDDARRDRFERR